ncbi:MAG: LppP/LprE family lipoprotein [Solirubrobacteraceae bacterium]
MPRPISARVWTAMLAATAMTLFGGCGGSTKTVSVAGAPTTSGAATAPTGTTTPPITNTTTTPTGTTTAGGASGGTPATTSTRSAKAPAFAEKEKGTAVAGLPAALALLRAHGYTANDTSDYHTDQTLRVLVGTGSHSNDGHDKQAFFFVDGHYLGTDSSRPSAQISVVSQSDTEVTLAYQLYRPNDPLCCPGGGTAHVRFQLNNGRLVPLDPIPPVSSTSGTSRQ